MLRGHFKQIATYSLIAALLASPAIAATPGSASRQARARALAARQADETAAVPGSVSTAAGRSQSHEGTAIRQVVGKQPGSRGADPQRTFSLLPNLFGGSGSQEPQTSQRNTSRSAAPGSPQPGGILNDLFGNRSEPTQATAQPVQDQPKEPVDWNGIPYHQARSRSAPQNPAPIRDPNPNETRLSGQSRLANAPRVSTKTNTALPQPPGLTPSSTSRRTVPAQVVSSRLEQSEAPVLSPLSSSRRSGRKDVPTLDASEIAAAKTAEVEEEDLVPKISRRRIKPDSATETKTIAKTPAATKPATSSKTAVASASPESKSSRRTPSADIANQPERSPEIAELQPAPQTPTPQTPAPAMTTETADTTSSVASSEPASSEPASSDATTRAASKATDVATNSTPSVEIAAAPPKPQSALPAPAKTESPQPRPQVSAPTQTQPNAIASIPAATPETAPLTDSPTTPARPAFATPALPVPSAPHMGTAGSVAGHRMGPPPTAFTPRTENEPPLKPAGTPFGPAIAPIGSGLTVSPSPQQPRLAQNPNQFSQTPNSQPATQQPLSTPGATASLGTPYQAGPQYQTPPQYQTAPQPQHTPYQAYQQTPPMPQSPPQQYPTMKQHSSMTGADGAATAQPMTVARSSESSDGAFRDRPFSAAEPIHRPAMRPTTNSQLSPEETAVASELPSIRVVTHGPRSVIIRQTHEFEIRVENRGSIDAAGLMVRTMMPNWAEVKGQTASCGVVENQTTQESDSMVWTIDSLPAGKTERLYVRLQALQSGRHDLDVDWTLLPQKNIATIEVREPKLDLLIDGPEQVVFGESQTYRVRVLNPGDGVAPNVIFTLSPNSPTPQTQRIGDIPSGKEAQFEVELTAQDLGNLKIHGLASGDLGLKAEAEKDILVAAAELESVLAGPEVKYQNTDAMYHLQVTNKGTATSKNIVAELALPPGVQYQHGIDSAHRRGTKLVWEIASLPPGASREYEFSCLMSSPGKQLFEFAAVGTAAGKTAVALDTRVESIADLVMTIQDPAAPAPVGSEVAYEILIKNRGSRQAENVRAIAQFSEGIEPRRIEGHEGQVLTGQVLFDPIQSIRPGEEVRIRVIAEAEREGHHRFRTEIRAGETVLVAEEATQYLAKRSQRVSRRSTSSSVR